MRHLEIGYKRVDRQSLDSEAKEEIINSIGVLTEMSGHLMTSAALSSTGEEFNRQTQSLCFAAEFINEVVLNLNGLLQK